MCAQKYNDITMFTLGSLDRLGRLIDLANVWDGPMSIAVSVSNSSNDIPIIVDAWLNTPAMRRNVDIHLLFNDEVTSHITSHHIHLILSCTFRLFCTIQFKSVVYPSKVFPINYLRSLALKNTRTELVMFVEGDYIVPNDFREKMLEKM